MHHQKYKVDSIMVKHCFKNEWRDGWFINDEAEGMYYFKSNIIIYGEKYTSELKFTGKAEIKRENFIRGLKKDTYGGFEELVSEDADDISFIKGKNYDSERGTIFDGEFKDGYIFNGTVYNTDGSVKCYIKNGEEQERE